MRALLAQLAPATHDVESNLLRLTAALTAHRDVDLAVFPELFLNESPLRHVGEHALHADDDALRFVRAQAAAHTTAVLVGFAERTPEGTVANSVACIDSDGALAGVYRKTHLFGDSERAAFAAGEELLVLSLDSVRIAPLICFDVEFPEPARTLARAGAELLVTIAANMRPYGPDHELAARARALDNRRPHLYVNRPGCAHGVEFTGHSCAIDSAGHIRALASGEYEQLLEVDVPLSQTPFDPDVEYLLHTRGELPVREAIPVP
jgi:predicted amidohydrolase